MVNAVCLRFDEQTTAAVERIWHELEHQGVSSDMARLGYPPHLTLVVMNEFPDTADVAELLGPLVTELPGKLLLGEPALFPGTEVVYLDCKPPPELRQLQSRLIDILPAASIHEHYRPGTWVPHVTLQNTGNVEHALGIAHRLWREMAATPTLLELVAFPPPSVTYSVAVVAPT